MKHMKLTLRNNNNPCRAKGENILHVHGLLTRASGSSKVIRKGNMGFLMKNKEGASE